MSRSATSAAARRSAFPARTSARTTIPRINSQNTQNNHLYATWQDYRNGEFDIQLSLSTDGGLTWHQAGTVNPDRGLDHYMPAVEQSPDRTDRVGRELLPERTCSEREHDAHGRVRAPA